MTYSQEGVMEIDERSPIIMVAAHYLLAGLAIELGLMLGYLTMRRILAVDVVSRLADRSHWHIFDFSLGRFAIIRAFIAYYAPQVRTVRKVFLKCVLRGMVGLSAGLYAAFTSSLVSLLLIGTDFDISTLMFYYLCVLTAIAVLITPAALLFSPKFLSHQPEAFQHKMPDQRVLRSFLVQFDFEILRLCCYISPIILLFTVATSIPDGDPKWNGLFLSVLTLYLFINRVVLRGMDLLAPEALSYRSMAWILVSRNGTSFT
jgi:hypothetical protein